jgi:RecA-family ATPase
MPVSSNRAITLIPFNDVRPNPRANYLVKGLIPRTGSTLLWGPPKSGKTFWIFDLAAHIAANRPYRGRKVNGGPVVYCCFEGTEGYGQRAEAVRNRCFPNANEAEVCAALPLYLVNARMNFAADHAELIAAVRTTLGDVNPAAVILDTLNRSLAGSESSDQDKQIVIVRIALGCPKGGRAYF